MTIIECTLREHSMIMNQKGSCACIRILFLLYPYYSANFFLTVSNSCLESISVQSLQAIAAISFCVKNAAFSFIVVFQNSSLDTTG